MLGTWMACESKREDNSCSCPLCPGTALATEQLPDDASSIEHANMYNEEEMLVAFRFCPPIPWHRTCHLKLLFIFIFWQHLDFQAKVYLEVLTQPTKRAKPRS